VTRGDVREAFRMGGVTGESMLQLDHGALIAMVKVVVAQVA